MTDLQRGISVLMLIISLGFAGVTAGCGKKGPLYLPEKEDKEAQATRDRAKAQQEQQP